jgi:diphthamide biosynthesis protein 2
MSAGKSYYTFVMGRLNEAKLCNFPEINVFCLLANDDNALVPPKTFHVPLVTPYELELGLGSRQWASKYMTSIRSVADSSTPVVVLSGDTVVLETKADGIASTDVNSDSISAYSSRDVVGFNSAAASLRRNFVGLAYDDAEKDDTSIHNGMFGIAQQYTPT